MFRFVSNRLVQVILLLALLTGLVALRMHDPKVIQRVRQLTFDTYNRLIPRKPGHGVAIVDIDEASLRAYGQWPWPRPLVAQISEILKEMGAKVIAFDMVFAEPDRTSPPRIAKGLPQTPAMSPVIQKLKELPDNDDVFAQKIAGLGNVVTGFVGAINGQYTHRNPTLKASFWDVGVKPNPLPFITTIPFFTTSLPAIANASAGNGSFTMNVDQDGIVRKVPLLIGQKLPTGEIKMYPALSLEALRVALGKSYYKVTSFGQQVPQGYGIQSVGVGDYTIPTDEKGQFHVYYTGHRPDLYISAKRVLERDPSIRNLVKDKIVFVGTSAIGLLDLRSSPLDAVLPGVEIHAEIIEQILGHQFLVRPGFFDGAELCIMIAISLGIIFLAPFIGAGTLAFIATMLIGSGVVGSLFAYQHSGLLIDPVYPSLTIVIIFILSSILTNLRSEMERRAVKTAFGHYISPTLMEELANDPDKLKLGGEVRELSVMFTDIRNFTTISETMDPAELIKMMNDFLTPMTSCVLDNRGTIDKYMGDAMMAFWNAPLDDPDHAVHACTAALQMLTALKVVNIGLREQAEKSGRPFKELKAGIGIHTGRASVGNMGSKQRFAYSALGDTVNLASRLEGQTKGYGISAMISEEVRKRAPAFAALEIDLLTVKGRKEPERVYTLLGDATLAASAAFQEASAMHNRMLAAYRNQRWEEALALAGQCEALQPDLAGLYALYRQRVAEFKLTQLPAGWQGVWVAKEKS